MTRPAVDFIIIGAMKCATSTLHDQLAAQPGIFMSEPKEPCFFSDDPIYARGIDWYRDLFAAAGREDLRGESSTHYTKLPTWPRTVRRMGEHLPDVKLIYVIRHPIDRLVSQYIHEWTERNVDVPIDDAIDALPILVDYSRYAMQLRPYLDAYGSDRILLVYFEKLVSQPQPELERVARFIGYSGAARWVDSDAVNQSSQRLRKNGLRDALVWSPVASWVRRRFVPRTVRDRIKAWWQMSERPQFSETSQRRLEEIFDEDLAMLGQWIDTPLNCRDFKTLAKTATAQWVQPVGSA